MWCVRAANGHFIIHRPTLLVSFFKHVYIVTSAASAKTGFSESNWLDSFMYEVSQRKICVHVCVYVCMCVRVRGWGVEGRG